MNLSKKISQDILTNTVLEGVLKIRGIAILLFVTNVFGLAGFGAFTQVITVSFFARFVSELRLHAALINLSQKDQFTKVKLYHTVIITVTTLTLLSTALLMVFSRELSIVLLGTDIYRDIFLVGALLTPANAIALVTRGFFRANMQIRAAVLLKTGQKLLSLLIAALLVVGLAADLFSFLAALVVVELAFVISTHLYITTRFGFEWPDVSLLDPTFTYSIPYALAIFSNLVSDKVDRLVIGIFLGATAVGIYEVAYRVANVLFLVLKPIELTFFPEFSRLLEEGREEEVGTYIRNGITYFLLISIPSIIGLYVVGTDILRFVASQELMTYVNVILAIITVGIAFSGIDKIYATILLAEESTASLFRVRLAGAALNLILNVVLIPVYGIVAAAATTAVTYAITAVLVILLSRKFIPVSFDSSAIAKSLASGVLMGAGLLLLRDIHFLILIPVGAIFYFFILILFGGVGPVDRRHLEK